MFSTDDSIVALATPPGRGGIGVVRISGPAAHAIGCAVLRRDRPLQPRHATFAHASLDTAGDVRDEVVATYYPAPRSFTGEETVEISAHGNPVVLSALVEACRAAGARLAQPGEFTLRAFLNGKRDLVQAEAVADLIDAATPLQARVACDQLHGTLTDRIRQIDAPLFDLIAKLEASLDFPDEGYHFVEPPEVGAAIDGVRRDVWRLLRDGTRGRLIREGATVVVAGRPNVGKSSIFNCLAGCERAIVTPVAGTTRDLVIERVDIEGLPVTLVDTAGWREARDVIEQEGIARGVNARLTADLVVLVLDGSEPLTDEDRTLLVETATTARVIAGNKCDLPAVPHAADVRVSAKTGEGLDRLRAFVAARLTGSESLRDGAAVTNVRHLGLLREVDAALARASDAVGSAPEECVLIDLQAARARLDEIVGVRTSEDVLRRIFERFCIGK